MTRRRKPRTATIPSCFRWPASVIPFLAFLSFLTINVPCEARQPPRPEESAVIFGTVWGPDDRPVPGSLSKYAGRTKRRAAGRSFQTGVASSNSRYRLVNKTT